MRLISPSTIDRVFSLAPLAQPQRTALFSDFWGGRPCLDFAHLIYGRKNKTFIALCKKYNETVKKIAHCLKLFFFCSITSYFHSAKSPDEKL